MTEQELKEIEARCEKATPGPWFNDIGNGQVETESNRVEICNRAGNFERKEDIEYRFGDEIPNDVLEELKFDNEQDMEFIAHARTDIPALVAEVRRLQESIQETLKVKRMLFESKVAAEKERDAAREENARLRHLCDKPSK